MTSDDDLRRAIALLEEIRANQTRQLAQHAEALTLQRQQLELVRRRAERIQERAERIQDRSARLVGGARKATVVILAIVTLLIAYLSWLLFRAS